tara:strand:+ start:161 stop:358 length:198 start_codon:yes stop_codon:yes gene_type:complete
MIIEIGALVIIKVNFQLSRNIRITEGDYGIVIGYPAEESTCIFDYLVVCNGINIFLFKSEIELVN